MKKNKLTEFFLINRIRKKFKKYKTEVIKGIGDDCAVVKLNKNKCLLYTCDSQVSGVHFLETHSSPYDIGRKAAAVNLSDIAAMGGTPKYMLVSLFLPKISSEKFIDELYKGLNEECKKFDVRIIGGNISKSNQFIIDIFLTGEVEPKNLILRSGAQVGDVVMVTGTLGNSSPESVPNPRVREGIQLGKSGMVTSMIDLSDGLSSDIQHICDESNVGVKLFLEELPTLRGIEKLTVLNKGEDYELCFTVRKKNMDYFPWAKPVGEIIQQKQGRWLIDGKGNKKRLIAKGWDHFT